MVGNSLMCRISHFLALSDNSQSSKDYETPFVNNYSLRDYTV